jgi:hypothetical protein
MTPRTPIMCNFRTAFIAPLLAAAGTGCALLPPSAPTVDTTFGSAVRQGLVQQTYRQRAATVPDTGELDAQAARSALNRYRDSFKTPPPSFTVIGIGGSSAP